MSIQMRSPGQMAALAYRYLMLLRSQYWPREKLRRYQLQQFSTLLRHAYDSTLFYRRLMNAAGANPAVIDDVQDTLNRLPLVDKQTLLSVPLSERLARGVCVNSLIYRHTSGTTGEPFGIYLSQYEKDARVLLELRFLRALGIGPRARMLEIRRLTDLTGDNDHVSFMGLFTRVGLALTHTSEAKLTALRASDAEVLKGHVSSLIPMAESQQGQAKPNRLRCILSSAEFLDASARKHVQDAFGVPLYDQYGMVEFGFIGWECQQQSGVHVSAEDFIVEIINDAGNPCMPGESGEIVITALKQMMMPLIRYRTGDRAMWIEDPCACGRSLPRFRLLRGRTLDFVLRPDGSQVTPHFFTCLWEGVEGIRQFQFVQDTLTSICFRYVPHSGANQTRIESEMHDRLAAELGSDMEIRFEVTESILPDASGKTKYLISHVGRQVSQSLE